MATLTGLQGRQGRRSTGRPARRRVACLWAAVCLLAAAPLGCGPSTAYQTATIDGAVTLDGAPIERGTITFMPMNAGLGGGGSAAIAAGRYRLTGVPVGEVGFTFTASQETGRTIQGPGGQPEPERINPIPDSYRTEGVVRTIDASGAVDFPLESRPR